MCDYATETKIINAVKDMIQKRKMFTAFDITRIINEGLSSRLRNGEVKKIVHAMFNCQQMADYDRDIVAIPSADPNRPPFVYFPPEEDPNSYDPISNLPASLSNVTTSVPSVGTTPANAPVDADEDDEVGRYDTAKIGDTVKLSRQGNGFVRIPAAFMRAIGAEPHDEVEINACVDTTEIRKVRNCTNVHTTDDRNNLRVYRHLLQGVGQVVTLAVLHKDTLRLS